ncbi:MAG: hypothetical protein ABJA57_04745 [Ginsengibacter sp.]
MSYFLDTSVNPWNFAELFTVVENHCIAISLPISWSMEENPLQKGFWT